MGVTQSPCTAHPALLSAAGMEADPCTSRGNGISPIRLQKHALHSPNSYIPIAKSFWTLPSPPPPPPNMLSFSSSSSLLEIPMQFLITSFHLPSKSLSFQGSVLDELLLSRGFPAPPPLSPPFHFALIFLHCLLAEAVLPPTASWPSDGAILTPISECLLRADPAHLCPVTHTGWGHFPLNQGASRRPESCKAWGVWCPRRASASISPLYEPEIGFSIYPKRTA